MAKNEDTPPTAEEIAEMERKVRDYRTAQAREAQSAILAAVEDMQALIADGTLQKVQDAAAKIVAGMGQADSVQRNLNASANAIVIGSQNLFENIGSLPLPAPADAPTPTPASEPA